MKNDPIERAIDTLVENDEHRGHSRYGWIITRDELENRPVNIIGPNDIAPWLEADLRDGKGEDFALYDDDGTLYFTGKIVGDYTGFEPKDDYGEAAGATGVKLNGEWL